MKLNANNPATPTHPLPGKARLVWTRRELVAATGLCYRTIMHLEARGLLQRVPVGVNVACYSDASVQALFGNGESMPPAGSQDDRPKPKPSPPAPLPLDFKSASVPPAARATKKRNSNSKPHETP